MAYLHSPTDMTGLLEQNATFHGAQPTVINPIGPYLFMSPQTCTTIAQNLPVTLDTNTQLYMWNQNDPVYERIVQSSAYLAFVFQNAGAGSLTIKVPFPLLNLTLKAPIVTTSRPYFPCRPFHASDNSGNYVLGKAFLQAAFIGMNWEQNKFFMAQAPGPGVGASNVQSIGPNDTSINSDPIENFATTWANGWTVITSTTNPAGQTSREGSNSDLSNGAKAGIGVGVAIGAICVLVALVFCCIRRRKSRVVPRQDSKAWEPEPMYRPLHEKDSGSPTHEISSALPHEMGTDSEVHGPRELDTRDDHLNES